jgi:23S rRNA (cytidine1920-2'-O)/16S rRNA (cytidine1409-2'-O)-methyltransferase
VAVEGRVVLDVGASTGGFTEVCLDRGAAKVFAVDVGFGQMHDRVAADPRVVNLERTDARDLTSELIPEAPALVVCDASFISLIKVLPAALDLAAVEADLITLIKPQFEADGPGGGKKGVVKDPVAHAAAVERVRDWLEAMGWAVQATTESPITGGDGNVEFLLWAKKPD